MSSSAPERSSGAAPDAPPGPALGIDLGTRRIGVALTDSRRVLARPLTIVERSGDDGTDRRAIAGLVTETGATTVVVGLPLSLSGGRGPAARRAAEQAEALAGELLVPVVLQDERLTTVEATRRIRDGGERTRRGVRQIVDDRAAAILLQAYIDRAPRR